MPPTSSDVIIATGGKYLSHPGNKAFRQHIDSLYDQYDALEPLKRKDFAEELYDYFISSGVRFLKPLHNDDNNQQWEILERTYIVEIKIMQRFREVRKKAAKKQKSKTSSYASSPKKSSAANDFVPSGSNCSVIPASSNMDLSAASIPLGYQTYQQHHQEEITVLPPQSVASQPITNTIKKKSIDVDVDMRMAMMRMIEEDEELTNSKMKLRSETEEDTSSPPSRKSSGRLSLSSFFKRGSDVFSRNKRLSQNDQKSEKSSTASTLTWLANRIHAPGERGSFASLWSRNTTHTKDSMVSAGTTNLRESNMSIMSLGSLGRDEDFRMKESI